MFCYHKVTWVKLFVLWPFAYESFYLLKERVVLDLTYIEHNVSHYSSKFTIYFSLLIYVNVSDTTGSMF